MQDPREPEDHSNPPTERSAADSEGAGHHRDNIEALRTAAKQAARAEPSDRDRAVVLASQVVKDRVPRWLLPVLAVVLFALTVLNLAGRGPFAAAPPAETEAEARAGVRESLELQAEWIEEHLEVAGALPVPDRDFDFDGIGEMEVLGPGEFRLVLRESDGWTGVYDSRTGKISVSRSE